MRTLLDNDYLRSELKRPTIFPTCANVSPGWKSSGARPPIVASQLLPEKILSSILLDFCFELNPRPTSMRSFISFAIVILMTTVAVETLSAQTLPAPEAITDPKQVASKPNAEVEPRSLTIEKLYMTRQVGLPTWSPDGKQIAFISNMSGRNNIWLVPAEGGWPVQLTVSDQRQTAPAWSLTVSCTGQPPSAGTSQILFRPLIFEMKATCLPSGDQVGRPTWRVMYSFSMVRLRGSTSAFGLLATCLGSVMASGAGRVCAERVSTATVVIRMTIANEMKERMEVGRGLSSKQKSSRMEERIFSGSS